MDRSLLRPTHGLVVLSGLGYLVIVFLVARLLPEDRQGPHLITTTARLSVLYFFMAVTLVLVGSAALAGWAWTLGCAIYLVHVAVSFHYAHNWSHAQAFDHVAETSGFGAGIFVSYLFTLVWILDGAWWWVSRRGYTSRPTWVKCVVYGFMLFVVINAGIVFATGAVRYLTAVGLGVAILAMVGRYRSGSPG